MSALKHLWFPLLVFFLLSTGCNDNSSDEIVINDSQQEKEACYPSLEDNTFDVATWNIENYPVSGNLTKEKVKEILLNLDADIIALQEISDVNQFTSLISSLEDWDVKMADVRYNQEIGYVYKADQFVSVGSVMTLFNDDSYNFPREVVKIDVTHISGNEFSLMNLHLKCCGNTNSEEFDRRASASYAIEDYLENNLDSKAVIVLGDYNDEITGITPFQNLLDDTEMRFADQDIAEGSSENWSYPSFPSHIDHIMISDELFGELGSVQTLILEDCISNYASQVSDHRPVMASFSFQ